MRPSRLWMLLALLPAFALAETDQERQAREALERELKMMVGTPPTKVKVLVVGLDQPNYELQEASFKLDGRNLPVPGGDLKKLTMDGEHLIFHGDVQPGQHRLESRFTFKNTTSQVVSVEGGYTWKPGSDVSFPADRGIEVTIKVTPELNMSGDIKQRITVKSPATTKMLAKLDDGTMPEPPPRPNIVVAAEPADAGVEVVKGETAEEKAKAAAEAKKRAAEEAKAAKLAAAEEKKRKAEEAKAAKLAAAEEKKRKAAEAKAARLAAAEEAKAAKLAAAEEKKRKADEAKAAKDNQVAANTTGSTGTAGTTGTTGAQVAAETVDAGAPVAAAPAEVDAGQAVVAVAPPPPVKPPEPTPAPPVEGGLPLPLIVGVGVAVVGLILFLLARRKKS